MKFSELLEQYIDLRFAAKFADHDTEPFSKVITRDEEMAELLAAMNLLINKQEHLMTLNVKDKVEFHDTSDSVLDGHTGTVEGFCGADFPIVQFTHPHPVGHNPAIIITKHCLKKI